MKINKNNFHKIITKDIFIDYDIADYITYQLTYPEIYKILVKNNNLSSENKLIFEYLVDKICNHPFYTYKIITSYISHQIPINIYQKAIKTVSRSKKHLKELLFDGYITKNANPECWREAVEVCLKQKKIAFQLIQSVILLKESDYPYWEKAIKLCLKNINHSVWLVNNKVLKEGDPFFDEAILKIISKKNMYIRNLINYGIVGEKHKYYNKILKLIKKHENKS